MDRPCGPPTVHETLSPSLRRVPRVSSPGSTVLWDAPTPCRPSRRTSLPSLGDTTVASPVRLPPAGTRAVDQPGVGNPGLRAGSDGGDGRVSQVPERPSCPCALFLDPGRTEVRQAIAASRRGPRLCQQRWLPQAEDFGARSHGIGTRCLRFAVEVSFPHARLASGCWPSSAGRDSLTRRVAMKGFRVRVSSSFLELTFATHRQIALIGAPALREIRRSTCHFGRAKPLTAPSKGTRPWRRHRMR